MPSLRQDHRNVDDGDLQSLKTNGNETRRHQANNEPPNTNIQQASMKSPSSSDSSVPYPFDSQSSLENEEVSHGVYCNTVETMSRS